jgi:hypothetical protein
MNMKYRLAGIRRENQYSPNHIGNDAAIFNLATEYLRAKGCEVTVYSETEFWDADIRVDAIFNMARDWRSIRKLQELENRGACVVNSGYGIENCTREKMTRLLVANHIPHPDSVILNTSDADMDELRVLGSGNFWIKRGDFHAIHREDVTFAGSPEEAENILKEYALRDIPSVVINKHLQGDLIKFYGVSGSGFFHWFYPNDSHHSKFGLEEINGKTQGIPFDADCLKEICRKAGKVLNVHIYGGDAVVSPRGIIRIIDFNDWPSFAPCRREAAPFIADVIYDCMLQHRSSGCKVLSNEVETSCSQL